MCIFTNDKDIPPYVRISTRTLQYFVIPILSIALITVGSKHLSDCPGQTNLPIWHIVAGASGLLVPVLYILFDNLNPRMASNQPLLSEILDNAVVFIIPVYVLFEVAWLITGTYWLVSAHNLECDVRVYTFSTVVIINFWIHLLTPVAFITSVCCSRIFPFLGYCTYWHFIKNAIDVWTFNTRFVLSVLCSFPLSCAMIGVGINGIFVCQQQGNVSVVKENVSTVIATEISNSLGDEDGQNSWLDLGDLSVPIWLIIAGSLLIIFPAVYALYDKVTKAQEVESGCWNISVSVVIFYLLCGLSWALLGFVWILGVDPQDKCNEQSFTHKFAFASLIILNVLMDAWICIKISIVLYWSLLSEDDY
eukprot:TRINITY_DN29494_c0_g1_i4.p1 TRINITY_DN29494_c0_g1~~TRINITY_DN29494_c0_g1_i4.p1  ORF type:complete len:363 (+),score=5.24 TRINITY_DN29494_c0_g1_i4:68-1156(+)